MNIKYEDIENAILNYWSSSDKLQNLIKSLSFDNLKTINISKEYLIDNINKMLSDKLSKIKYYENLTDKDLYDLVVNNKLNLINEQFFTFFQNLLKNKFDENEFLCLSKYLYELRKMQIYYLYFKHKNVFKDKKYINNNVKNENKEEFNEDFINKYDIDEKFLHIYDNNILNEILKEYYNGTSYRKLVKKYHPDTGFTNDEYIKIINDLKKEKIIS